MDTKLTANPAPTGTGLDRLIDIILSDEGLQARIPDSEIVAGAEAAAEMNAIIVEAIVATGVAANGRITAGDVRELSDWIRANAAAAFTRAHGDDEGDAETGFHLVQNDGGAVRLYGRDAVDTVADGIYHLVFGHDGANIVNEDGNRNARLEDIAWWLDELLEAELAEAALGQGPLAPAQDPLDLALGGTGLDRIVEIGLTDPGLERNIPTSELAEGGKAAVGINGIVTDAILELGLVNDGAFTASDAYAVSELIRADPALKAAFDRLHGDDEDGEETGYHLWQDDGATTRLFSENAIDRVGDGIYHIGFGIEEGRFLNEDGNKNASVGTVAAWIQNLIEDELDTGALVSATSLLEGGSTGTGLDRIVTWVETDAGLNDRISLYDISGGAMAADGMNALLLGGIEATGVANDGRISTADMRDVTAWLRSDGDRYESFVALHGDDEDGVETGFHLVQGDGATGQAYGDNAVNTVGDGIYHFGFEIRNGRYLNEDGNTNQTVADVAAWVNALLTPEDFAELANPQVTSFLEGSTGTGLDLIVDIVMRDPRLEQRIATSEIVGGAEAADAMNALLIDGIEATGAGADGVITGLDMYEINAWMNDPANATLKADFITYHGDDEEGVETGFHLVQGDGAVTELFDRNAVDTIADGIYHFGFAIEQGRFLNEDGNRNASVETVASWVNALLAEDLASGRFYDPAFDPAEVDLAALNAEHRVRLLPDASPDGEAGHYEEPDSADFDLGPVTVMFAVTPADLDGRQGLFSRDGSGFQEGGHTTIWAEGDDIKARIQTDEGEVYVHARDVLETGETTHVALSLDGQIAKLYIGGALVAGAETTATWLAAADEDITIGASAWQQRDADDNTVRDVFNGTLAEIQIFDKALSLTEIQAAGGVTPALPPDPLAPDVSVVMPEGTSGTGFDRLIEIITTDPGLAARTAAEDIREGALAADVMANITVDAIKATGVANDGALTAADMRDVSDWIANDGALEGETPTGGVRQPYLAAHGDDEGDTETGFHLVQNDGGAVRIFGDEAIDTVADGLFHMVFGYEGANIVNEDGNRNAELDQLAYWASELLAGDLAEAAEGRGPLHGVGARFALTGSGTGLDIVEEIVFEDPGLTRKVSTADMLAATEAAFVINGLIVAAIGAYGLADDGEITASDVHAINAHIRSDAARYQAFYDAHGNDEGDQETGYHRVQNDGATTALFDRNAVDTIFDGIYHIGFAINESARRLTNEDGDDNASLEDVAYWLNELLKDDLQAGTLVTGAAPSGTGSTGTGLDQIVGWIVEDPGLARKISTLDIRAGAEAADKLIAMVVEAIVDTGVAQNGQIRTSDIHVINDWFRADPARLAQFVAYHGDDEDGEETGFHLVQNDGGETRVFDDRAIDTVADGIFHLGFGINERNGRLTNEDGNDNASIRTVAGWLDALLTPEDYEALAARSPVNPYVYGATGTGLDFIPAAITEDDGLIERIGTDEIEAGARAADGMNRIVLEAIEATGAANDGVITALDVAEMNGHIRADADLLAEWTRLHGDDEDGEETGFHLVQGDGARTEFDDDKLVDTVADGIYHMGFAIEQGRFLNEDGNRNASLSSVAEWLNGLLAEDLAGTGLRNPDFDPGNVDLAALKGRTLFSFDETLEVDRTGGDIEVPHSDAFRIGAGTVIARFTPAETDQRMTVFSRDGNGNQEGGHLTAFVDGDDIRVRFQDVEGEVWLEARDAIAPGQTYTLAVSFDGSVASLYLDGIKVDAEVSGADWEMTVTDLQIGGNIWSQRDNDSTDVRDRFVGTIDHLSIVEGALNFAEIQALTDDLPVRQPGYTPPPPPEPVEPVLDFFLFDTETDQPIGAIDPDTPFDPADLAGAKVSVVAIPAEGASSIGSVVLELADHGQVENEAPYALFGDTGGDLKGGEILGPGTYEVSAKVFDGANGTGSLLSSQTVAFTVDPAAPEEAPADPVATPPEAPSAIFGFFLYDTGTDRKIAELGAATTFTAAELDGRDLTIVAEPLQGAVGSVRFEAPGLVSQTENVEPYAMFGDRRGDLHSRDLELDAGDRLEVTVTAFSLSRGRGEVLDEVALSIQVVEEAALASDAEFVFG